MSNITQNVFLEPGSLGGWEAVAEVTLLLTMNIKREQLPVSLPAEASRGLESHAYLDINRVGRYSFFRLGHHYR